MAGEEAQLPHREFSLTDHPDAIQRIVRALSASVNVRVLQLLASARAAEPAHGWVFLSEIAKELGEAPGTVSLAVQKLVPDLVEEKREKGRRYFRSKVTRLGVALATPEEEDTGRVEPLV